GAQLQHQLRRRDPGGGPGDDHDEGRVRREPLALRSIRDVHGEVAAEPPGNGMPTGSVTFYDGEQELGTVDLDAKGQAALRSDFLAVGTHTITADYNGDVNFAGGTSDGLAQVVNASTSGSVDAAERGHAH